MNNIENHLNFSTNQGGAYWLRLGNENDPISWTEGETLTLNAYLYDPEQDIYINADQIAGDSGYIQWYDANGNSISGGSMGDAYQVVAPNPDAGLYTDS